MNASPSPCSEFREMVLGQVKEVGYAFIRVVQVRGLQRTVSGTASCSSSTYRTLTPGANTNGSRRMRSGEGGGGGSSGMGHMHRNKTSFTASHGFEVTETTAFDCEFGSQSEEAETEAEMRPLRFVHRVFQKAQIGHH
jgi:hypothetical protein